MEHSFRPVSVIEAISKQTGFPIQSMILHGKNKANYINFKNYDERERFVWLNEYGTFPFKEYSCGGFGSEVKGAIDFPKDGIILPMVIDNLTMIFAQRAKLVILMK